MAYNTGLWGSERDGVGAFYFGSVSTTTYYVDLDLGTSGNAGTSADPFDYNDFKDSLNNLVSYVQVVYKIKGTYESSTISLTNGSVEGFVDFEPWSLSAHGPWILSGTTIDFGITTSAATDKVEGAMIDGSVCDLYADETYNCWLQGSVQLEKSVPLSAYGCTIVASTIETNVETSDVVYIENCVVEGSFSVQGTGHSLYLNNSLFTDAATSVSAGSTSVTANNCYFGWSNPAWPSEVTLAKESFNFNQFLSASSFYITYFPYGTWDWYGEYETGLWGYGRYGIGAFYFPDVLYVDLSANSATSGIGTSGSPWTGRQSYEAISNYLPPNSTFKMRGIENDFTTTPKWSYELLGRPAGYTLSGLSGTVTFESWDLSAYGLWGFDTSSVNSDDYNIINLEGEASAASFVIRDNVILANDGSNAAIGIGRYYLTNHTTKSFKYLNSMILLGESGGSILIGNDTTDGLTIEGVTIRGYYNLATDNSFSADTIIKDTVIYIDSGIAGNPYQFLPDDYVKLMNVETNFSANDTSAYEVSAVVNESDAVTAIQSATYLSFDKENYIYEDFGFSVTPSNRYEDIPYGIGGLTRDGVGAFYFYSIPGTGHIGSFYFGPISETVSASVMELSAVMLQPIVSSQNAISATVTPVSLIVNCQMLQPQNVYATQDFEIDFVGTPLGGSSPLSVEFKAIVNLSPELKGKYRVKNYKWCFDYDYDNETCNIPWVTTTQNPYTHVYTGYRGQKYSVKCCVTLELI